MARQPRRIMRQGAADLPTRGHVLAYIGPSGEIISDGDTLRLQDGVTPGGIILARSGRREVRNATYTVVPTDSYVGVGRLTAPLLVTLPSAAFYQPGQVLYIADETGQCSDIRPIIIEPNATDTIAGQSSMRIISPYQKIALHSNGAKLWTYA